MTPFDKKVLVSESTFKSLLIFVFKKWTILFLEKKIQML